MSLYAGGRQADALDALRRARDILAEELGMDPGPALLQVETDVLRQRLAIARPPVHETRGPADPAAEHIPVPAPSPPHQKPGATTPAGASDLFGRDVELNALHALAAEAAQRAERRVVLIAGEAGAGKSALVDRFARELRSNQWRVVVGRCPESAGAPPAWAWVEALQALAADVDPGRLAPALAPLIDDIPTTPGESDASFGRFLLTRAVVGYLTAAAQTRPLAVFLDDLHRGDSETLALLDGVAAGVSGVPLVVIAAYRPAEVPAGLRDALAGLAAVPPTRIALDGLDPAQAARLIRSIAGVQPDQPTLRALVDRTGGNPFYLTESARLLGSEGRLVATSKVPEGVRDVLRRRFARLPEITVAVLRLAAVIGRDVDIDVLVLAAEVDEETVLDALEAGVLAGSADRTDIGLGPFRPCPGPRHPVRRPAPAASRPLACPDRRCVGVCPTRGCRCARPPLSPGRDGGDRQERGRCGRPGGRAGGRQIRPRDGRRTVRPGAGGSRPVTGADVR